MKKTFTNEQMVGISRGSEVSGLTIKGVLPAERSHRRNVLQMAQSIPHNRSF